MRALGWLPVDAHLPACLEQLQSGSWNNEKSLLFVAAIKIMLSAFPGTSGRVSKYVDDICNLLNKFMVCFWGVSAVKKGEAEAPREAYPSPARMAVTGHP